MQQLNIQIVEGVHQAPHYRQGHRVEGHRVQPAILYAAIVVPRGTEEGKPTVDLQFLINDANGQTIGVAVAMVTGAILQNLASMIKGVEERGV